MGKFSNTKLAHENTAVGTAGHSWVLSVAMLTHLWLFGRRHVTFLHAKQGHEIVHPEIWLQLANISVSNLFENIRNILETAAHLQ